MISQTVDIVWTDPDIHSDRVEWGKRHSASSDIDLIVHFGQPSKSDIALDYITGIGNVALAISPFVKTVDALDPDVNILEKAKISADERGINNINFIAADADSIPAKDRTYDLIIARMALRHEFNPSKCLKEIMRVLKPDGRLIIVDFLKPLRPDLAGFFENLHRQWDRSHVRGYDLGEWEAVLDREGFDINRIEIFYHEYDFDSWVKETGKSAEVRRMMALMFHKSNPRVKRHFRIKEVNNQPVSFVLWMVLIVANPRVKSG